MTVLYRSSALFNIAEFLDILVSDLSTHGIYSAWVEEVSRERKRIAKRKAALRLEKEANLTGEKKALTISRILLDLVLAGSGTGLLAFVFEIFWEL